jgi:hypothetical protein
MSSSVVFLMCLGMQATGRFAADLGRIWRGLEGRVGSDSAPAHVRVVLETTANEELAEAEIAARYSSFRQGAC